MEISEPDDDDDDDDDDKKLTQKKLKCPIMKYKKTFFN